MIRKFLSAVILAGTLAISGCAHGWPVASVLTGGGSTPTPPPLAVSLSPGSPATAAVSFSTSGTYTTNTVTATATGGTAPYGFHWSYVSGSATPTVNSPNARATTYSATVTAGTTYNAVWKMVVTDSLSHTASANVNVNFTPATSFPLDALARGVVGDNITQTLLQVASSGAPNYTPTPLVSFCTVDVTGACASSADMDNMVNAGLTYMRIPVDAQQVIAGIPYPTSYLQFLAGTSGNSYNATTGLVTLTADSATNLSAPVNTTASAASAGSQTLTVASATGVITGAVVTDSTTPTAINSGTTVIGVSGTTLTLSVNTVGVGSGDALKFSYPVYLSNAIMTCTYPVTSTAAFTGVKVITVSSTAGYSVGSTITDTTTPSAIPAGTTITQINAATNTLTLSANVTSMGSGNALSIVSSSCGTAFNALTAKAGYNAATGTSGTTVKFTVATGLNITSLGKVTFSNIWTPLSPRLTRTLSNTNGCEYPNGTYITTTCVVNYDLAYLDTIINTATDPSRGLAVDLAPFVPGLTPNTAQMISGFSNSATSGLIHEDMGLGLNCYGIAVMSGATCFEQMLLLENTALVTRYAAVPQANYFQELYNEPFYKTTIAPPNYLAPNTWNVATRAITAAIRAIDPNRWIIDDGISAAKAQYAYSLTPNGDARTVYAIHKYDPVQFANQKQANPFNPLALYPVENSTTGGSPSPAIGRPGGVVSTTLPSPAPTLNNPSWQTTVNSTCAGAAWTNPLTGAGQKVACVNGTLYDYYLPLKPGSNFGFTKDDLLNNPFDGVNLAVTWASSGGHGIGIYFGSWSSGTTTLTTFDDPTVFLHVGDTITVGHVDGSPNYNGTFTVSALTPTTVSYAQAASPGGYQQNCAVGGSPCTHGVVTQGAQFSGALKIVYGEIGFTHWADYRSRIQFLMDIRSVLESTSVPGGQASIPWDVWAFDGTEFGIRPKSGGISGEHYCLGTVGGVAGYDLDDWSVMATPQVVIGTAANPTLGILNNGLPVGELSSTPYTAPYCSATTARPDFGTPGLP